MQTAYLGRSKPNLDLGDFSSDSSFILDNITPPTVHISPKEQ